MIDRYVYMCVTGREKITKKKSLEIWKVRYISVIRSSLEWAGISDACEGEVGDRASKIDRDQSQRSLYITP